MLLTQTLLVLAAKILCSGTSESLFSVSLLLVRDSILLFIKPFFSVVHTGKTESTHTSQSWIESQTPERKSWSTVSLHAVKHINDTPCPPIGRSHFSPIQSQSAKHSSRPLLWARKMETHRKPRRRGGDGRPASPSNNLLTLIWSLYNAKISRSVWTCAGFLWEVGL